MTPRSADGITHSMQAAAYVFRLRRWGWPIATEKHDGQNKFEPVRFAVYRLVGVELGPREETYIATANRNAAVAASDSPGVGLGGL